MNEYLIALCDVHTSKKGDIYDDISSIQSVGFNSLYEYYVRCVSDSWAYVTINNVTAGRSKDWSKKRVKERHLCHCDRFDLVHFGCKCGGM